MTAPQPPKKRHRFLRLSGYLRSGTLACAFVLAVAGFAVESVAAWRERRLFPPPGQMVDVGGYRLHIQCLGNGSPTVVLDTGLGSGALSWGAAMPEIARHTRVCAFDRAGYGWSDTGPKPRTSSRITTELRALLHDAGIPGPYILVGWSFGGFTARLYAHRYPEETAGVVLVESAHEEQFARYVPAMVAGFKKAGLNLDGPVRWAGGPEQAHTAVETAAARLRLWQSRLGWARWSRRHERASAERFGELQHGYTWAVLEEKAAWEQSIAEMRGVRNLGNMPLVVVSRGRGIEGPYPAWFPAQEIEAAWQDMQKDLTRLSANSRQVFARRSDHLVPQRQPEIVVESVLSLLAAGRGSAAPAY